MIKNHRQQTTRAQVEDAVSEEEVYLSARAAVQLYRKSCIDYPTFKCGKEETSP